MSDRFRFAAAVIAVFWLGVDGAGAQLPVDAVRVTAYSSAAQVPIGADFYIVVQVTIKDGFHVNSNQPLEELYRATRVSYEFQEGISYGRVLYPEGAKKKFGFSDSELSVYEDRIDIFTRVTLSDRMMPGERVLRGHLDYQACNDEICFLPQQIAFEIPLLAAAASEPLLPANTALFEQVRERQARVESRDAMDLTRQEIEARAIVERGLVYATAAFFLFGLALNLTPCVYPVIPITVSYFGTGAGARQAGYGRAAVYVIGIALIFSVLGLASGLAGKQWGFLFQSPWFVLIVTLIILSMAASMFGAFEIRIPSVILTRLGRSREGLIGAFTMGLTVGVVIAPCAAGIILGLVGLVAKLGMVWQGTLFFFVMGLGLGLPYLFLARFSGLIEKMPQSGIWLIWIKKVFGVLLVGVALYFFLPQAKSVPDMPGFFFGLLTVFAGMYLGFLDSDAGYSTVFRRVRWILGALAMVFGLTMTHAAIQVRSQGISWLSYSGEPVSALIGDGPVFFDFYADWCAPCLEMDRKTFMDEQIIDLSAAFTMVKVDCTAPDDRVRDLMARFQVTGMPTYIFLDAQGRELGELREIGFVAAGRLEASMQRALQQY